ncbi:hypothetical protein HK096_001303 [Nowakowskiella sp. JEL0078]|nr:hypothetical protein HK096_001303 [Nowakowskiella sp. JEL0078]
MKCSKRCWDGLIRSWRRKLHQWDPPAADKWIPHPEIWLAEDEAADWNIAPLTQAVGGLTLMRTLEPGARVIGRANSNNSGATRADVGGRDDVDGDNDEGGGYFDLESGDDVGEDLMLGDAEEWHHDTLDCEDEDGEEVEDVVVGGDEDEVEDDGDDEFRGCSSGAVEICLSTSSPAFGVGFDGREWVASSSAPGCVESFDLD